MSWLNREDANTHDSNAIIKSAVMNNETKMLTIWSILGETYSTLNTYTSSIQNKQYLKWITIDFSVL